jgi:hypothetical protein
VDDAIRVLAVILLALPVDRGAWADGRVSAAAEPSQEPVAEEGPDLQIANVLPRTPGGLCAGSANTFQVMIRNGSRVPVPERFVVRLRIRRPAGSGGVTRRDLEVVGLDSLEVRSVIFRNVDLGEGLHAVAAIIDPENRIPERPAAAEGNNGFPAAGRPGLTPNVTRLCGAGPGG